MKTYSAPSIIARDVIGTTLLAKTAVIVEDDQLHRKPQGSPSLGFGL